MNTLHRFLEDFATSLEEILGGQIIGLYLHGSIALSAFDPESSDIDFAVVVTEPLTTPQSRALRKLHRTLRRRSLWGKRLDGYYLSIDGDGPRVFSGRYPYVLKGRFRRHDRFPAVARHILHTSGITLRGGPSGQLFANAGPDALRAEMHHNLHVYWKSRIRRSHLFLFDEMVDFAVMTLPRIIFTLETGAVIPKAEAMDFLRERFPEWSSLVDDVRSRNARKPSIPHRITRAHACLLFVRAMIEQGRNATVR